MEDTQNLIDQKKWRDYFCNVNRTVFVIAVLLEFMMFYVLSSSNMIFSSKEYYIKWYLIRPIAICFLILLLQEILIRQKLIRDNIKNWIPLLAMTLMFGVVAYIHYIFSAVLTLFCIPIFMSVVFGDKRMNIFTTILSVGMIGMALQNCLQRKYYEDDGYYIPGLLLSVALVVFSGCVSVMLCNLLKKQNRKMIRAMSEATEAKQKANEANEAKSAFLSNMSHEIRTPMNAITGITDVLLREEHSAQETEYLMNIKNSGNALLTIINDILDFSKIESGKLELVNEEYEFMSMLSDLAMMFWNRIGNKKIELLYDIDPKLPRLMYGDALRLRQVIINLMNNAIKFTEKGYVKLSLQVKELRDDDMELEFTVTDTGMGIREEDLQKLFQSFQQVDTKRNRSKEGTGLGLAISKQLIEMMGGSIQVTSTYGEGSQFVFQLHQKVVDKKYAAALDAVKKDAKRIGAFLSAPLLEDSIAKLARSYGRIFYTVRSQEELADLPIEILITDDGIYSSLKEELLTASKAGEFAVYVLQNPMKKKVCDSRFTVIHKPLYCLNFCQVLQGGSRYLVNKKNNESFMNFTAPTAQVLLVEDSEMNVTVAKALLRPLKLQIDVAEHGKRALEMIQEKRYDLILMDHMMPVMDGVEATIALRRMEGDYYKNVPVIALTANAVVEAKDEFKKAGMNDFVSKPIELKMICQKLRQWLPQEKIERKKAEE